MINHNDTEAVADGQRNAYLEGVAVGARLMRETLAWHVRHNQKGCQPRQLATQVAQTLAPPAAAQFLKDCGMPTLAQIQRELGL